MDRNRMWYKRLSLVAVGTAAWAAGLGGASEPSPALPVPAPVQLVQQPPPQMQRVWTCPKCGAVGGESCDGVSWPHTARMQSALLMDVDEHASQSKLRRAERTGRAGSTRSRCCGGL